jgi:hypothetical protein
LQALIHFFSFGLVPEPYRNRVVRELKTRYWQNPAGLLGFGSLLILLLGIGGSQDHNVPPGLSGLAILVAIGGLGFAGFVTGRRTHVVSVLDQPVVPPRNLGLVDSWHAVVAQIGRDYVNVYRRLTTSIAQIANMGIVCLPEVYGYRTPNGFEQRERLVVSKSQGQVHIHIYPFGDDIFIGWQAFLNWAQWAETVPVARKIEGMQEIEFRQLVTGGYTPNQFDLMDLNSLTELVHRRIERELRAILKESAIDHEIDFKIIRGDRNRAFTHSDQSVYA